MRGFYLAVSMLLGIWLLYSLDEIHLTARGSTQLEPSSRLYTLDADFDLGVLTYLNHAAPHNHQLQLDRTTSPLPFVNIAASARGTVIRIHAVTGSIIGEYWTAPQGMGRDPSRTTVDRLGNVWVTNRAESQGGQGSVTRIGVIVGGTRVSANGRPDTFGEYLKPPFEYNTCVDRNGDGLIRTSRTRDDIHFWTNAGGVDTDGGVETADDECIINFTRVGGVNARTVAVDARNDIWVGGANTVHEKVSGETGQPIPGTRFNLHCGGYGGLIDPQGVLWSTRYGAGLLRFDTTTGQGGCLGNATGNYGLGIDPLTGHLWQSSVGGDRRLYELDTAGRPLNAYLQPFDGQGVVVDGNSHVWMAEILGTRVWHLAPDPQSPGRHVAVGLVEGLEGVTGVAVDLHGKVWAPEINANRVSRIDPRLGGRGEGGYTIGAIDLRIDLGAGAGPYNYSDMTGFVSLGALAPQGTWTVVQDSGVDATQWGRIIWNTEPQGSQPPGATIQVEARAAATQAGLAGHAYIPITNAVVFSLVGRYIETRVVLRPSLSGASPILSDISIETAPSTPTPTVTASVTSTATSTPTVTASPTGTASPSVTPLPLTPTPSPTRGEGSVTPTATASATIPPTKTATPTASSPPLLNYLYLPLLRQFRGAEP